MNRFCHLIGALLITALSSYSSVTLAEEVFLDRIVAVVDQDIIMQSELIRRTDVIRQQLISRNTRLPDQQTLQKQVLDKLINDRLQMAEGNRNGIRVTDQALDRTMQKIADRNNLSLEAFKQQLEKEGQVYREVREQIREEMLITQVRQRLVNRRIKVSDQEVKNFLNSEQGQKNAQAELHLAHIMIPIPASPSAEQLLEARQQAEQAWQQLADGIDFAEVSVAVSKSPRALEGGDLGWRKQSELPELITGAIEGLEKGQFTRPFRLGGGFQIVRLIDSRGGSVRMVDQSQVRHILIKATEIRDEAESERFARRLHDRLQAGEDFAALAKEHSDDPGSGSLGGELGWVMPGQMVPAFESMMNSVTVGDISPVFKSRFGWHILQVTDRRKEDLGERIMANEARESIRRRKFTEELASWMREIRSEAYIEIRL